jgi:hypothetical protein
MMEGACWLKHGPGQQQNQLDTYNLVQKEGHIYGLGQK